MGWAFLVVLYWDVWNGKGKVMEAKTPKRAQRTVVPECDNRPTDQRDRQLFSWWLLTTLRWYKDNAETDPSASCAILDPPPGRGANSPHSLRSYRSSLLPNEIQSRFHSSAS